MSLLDLITGNTGNQVAEQAENKFRNKKDKSLHYLQYAPLIISYLEINLKTLMKQKH